MKPNLTLHELARLTGRADLLAAYAAAPDATPAVKAKATEAADRLAVMRPLILKANADRFPADVLALWLNRDGQAGTGSAAQDEANRRWNQAAAADVKRLKA